MSRWQVSELNKHILPPDPVISQCITKFWVWEYFSRHNSKFLGYLMIQCHKIIRMNHSMIEKMKFQMNVCYTGFMNKQSMHFDSFRLIRNHPWK